MKNFPNGTCRHGLLIAAFAAAFLSGCLGDGSITNNSMQAIQASADSGATIMAPLASGTTTMQLDPASLPEAVADQMVQPTFHVAPIQLSEPDDADAIDNASSAHSSHPRQEVVAAELGGLSTRRLTVQSMESARHHTISGMRSMTADGTATPMAAGSVVAIYSPAQIRAAYGLPALPPIGAKVSATQAAQMGAGQTIYIIDAKHDPSIAAELSVFSQKFGLPTCTSMPIATNASLPLASASTSGCELSIVYSTTSGTMTGTAPAYDSGWATEIALDVQWAHATAPLARIILIEAADATLNGLLGGVKLANSMGPGIVSMSFGANEGNWTASVDSTFASSSMTYLSATGDSGASVQWPAVSPNVVAVGGTTLTYSGSVARSEIAWSRTGGGTSMYTPAPGYQTAAASYMGSVARRTVADVSFNADPATGQYVAIMPPGGSSPSWICAGGTSISAPQWAGIIAVANALRAAVAKPALGAPHAVLYDQIATAPGIYTSVFADIAKGSDGTCSTCVAKPGYDSLTGLGTPNVTNLLGVLSGANAGTPAQFAPVVTPANISGTTGAALSFTVSASGPNPLTYSLSGAPSGMTISSAGIVTWPSPLAGTYSVTVTASDARTGLSGQGMYTVTITAPVVSAPVVASANINGRIGAALSFTISASGPNPLTYTLGGAPSGMTISSAGIVTWAFPVAGTYSVTVTAKDSKTGLTGQGTFKVTISSTGLVISAPAMTGIAGKPLTGTISISDPGVASVSVSLSAAPQGMSFSVTGMNINAIWPNPVPGNYSLKVLAIDSAGYSAQVNVPITVSAK